MTATDLPGGSPATDPGRPFVPATHPVRRAALLLLIVALALGAIWWSGLGSPRVQVPGTAGQYDLISRSGTAEITIQNDAPMGFDITHVTIEMAGVRTVGADVDGVPVERGGHVPGNGSATLTVEYVVDACPGGAPTLRWPLSVTTRTALGLELTSTRLSGGLLPHPTWGIAVPTCIEPTG